MLPTWVSDLLGSRKIKLTNLQTYEWLKSCVFMMMYFSKSPIMCHVFVPLSHEKTTTYFDSLLLLLKTRTVSQITKGTALPAKLFISLGKVCPGIILLYAQFSGCILQLCEV